MARLRLAALYALCAPWDGVVALLALVSIPLWGTALRRHRGVLWLDVRTGSVMHRVWPYSTTFGHVILLRPGLQGTSVEDHELVHVRQFEGAVCGVWMAAAAAGLGWALWDASGAALAVGLLAPWFSYFGASLAAWLQAQRPYLDNAFERHARAETGGPL